ncbi:MAG: hypothetical protein A2Y12_12525 [Planctomycetes bacterium GWF2_42_9]|nr:MAG: hypothetical protein A2Y12_12525 [Planctomycetes bacterium GWF2_42_9]
MVTRTTYKEDFINASCLKLVDYIKHKHHLIISEQVPYVKRLLGKSLQEHKENYTELLALMEIFKLLISESETHSKREEEVLFPYIEGLENYKKQGGTKSEISIDNVQNQISQIEVDHLKLENSLVSTIQHIAAMFKALDHPSDAFIMFQQAFNELAKEFREHMNLEMNILFPKIIELESEVRKINR